MRPSGISSTAVEDRSVSVTSSFPSRLSLGGSPFSDEVAPFSAKRFEGLERKGSVSWEGLFLNMLSIARRARSEGQCNHRKSQQDQPFLRGKWGFLFLN